MIIYSKRANPKCWIVINLLYFYLSLTNLILLLNLARFGELSKLVSSAYDINLKNALTSGMTFMYSIYFFKHFAQS